MAGTSSILNIKEVSLFLEILLTRKQFLCIEFDLWVRKCYVCSLPLFCVNMSSTQILFGLTVILSTSSLIPPSYPLSATINKTGLQPVSRPVKQILVFFLKVLKRRMLKAPPVNPRTYIFSVLFCNCRYYNAIVGTIFQNPRFATLGA